jgi:hemolysin D
MSGAAEGDNSTKPPSGKAVSVSSKNRPLKPMRRGKDELAFLPAALEIIETPASPAGRVTAMTIVGAAIFAIAWASIGKVDIVVATQ